MATKNQRQQSLVSGWIRINFTIPNELIALIQLFYGNIVEWLIKGGKFTNKFERKEIFFRCSYKSRQIQKIMFVADGISFTLLASTMSDTSFTISLDIDSSLLC